MVMIRSTKVCALLITWGSEATRKVNKSYSMTPMVTKHDRVVGSDNQPQSSKSNDTLIKWWREVVSQMKNSIHSTLPYLRTPYLIGK